jgi:glycylpeptide N-tetradecanoyltransferase
MSEDSADALAKALEVTELAEKADAPENDGDASSSEDDGVGGEQVDGSGAKKKKKKKKKKKAVASTETSTAVVANKEGGGSASGGGPEADLVSSLGMNQKDLLEHLAKLERKSKAMQKAEKKEFKFWSQQPVQQLNEKAIENEPIEIKTLDDVKKDPINLPQGFEWCNIDINSPKELLEMYTLLTENYVEDDNCQFRFDYSVDFLQWALTPPNFIKEWHVGVRNVANKKLLACITAIPAHMQVYDKHEPMVEINFLCVHKKLRSNRLAPVLIREITRRVNLCNIWQASYTAGVVLPKPVSRCRYYHRPINPKKLIEAKFSYLPHKTTMPNHIKSLRLPDTYKYPMRPMEARDAPQVMHLLNDYLSR